ncbi:hypothetical protein SAMN02799642_04457 [Methylobacterium brachiatum]|nr:hypothetical protein SAMN02799642_04457 [Methylobacterium brachiatum]
MRLQEFEDRIREIGKVAPDLAKNIDSRQPDFETLVAQLPGRAVEEFRDMSTACQFRL